MAELNISIKAEPVFHIGAIPLTNSAIYTSILVILFIIIGLKYNFDSKKAKSSKFKLFVDMLLKTLYDFCKSITGDQTPMLFPLLATLFFFIIFSNWSGLIPGVGSVGLNLVEEGKKVLVPILRGPTADLNTTFALALIAVFSIQYFGVKALGTSYFKKFINLSNPINTFIGLLDIISEISKIMSFSFRLFGNIFAGEVLLAVIGFLIPFLASLPFIGLELFVGFIQALVFMMLCSVFIASAMSSHEGHKEEIPQDGKANLEISLTS